MVEEERIESMTIFVHQGCGYVLKRGNQGVEVGDDSEHRSDDICPNCDGDAQAHPQSSHGWERRFDPVAWLAGVLVCNQRHENRDRTSLKA